MYRNSFGFIAHPYLGENEIQIMKILIITILSRFIDIDSRESLIKKQILLSRENNNTNANHLFFQKNIGPWLRQEGMVN